MSIIFMYALKFLVGFVSTFLFIGLLVTGAGWVVDALGTDGAWRYILRFSTFVALLGGVATLLFGSLPK